MMNDGCEASGTILYLLFCFHFLSKISRVNHLRVQFWEIDPRFLRHCFLFGFWLRETLRKNWPRHAGKFTTKKFWHSKWDLLSFSEEMNKKLTAINYSLEQGLRWTKLNSANHREVVPSEQPNDAATLAFVDRGARRKLWGLARNKRNKGVSPLLRQPGSIEETPVPIYRIHCFGMIFLESPWTFVVWKRMFDEITASHSSKFGSNFSEPFRKRTTIRFQWKHFVVFLGARKAQDKNSSG